MTATATRVRWAIVGALALAFVLVPFALWGDAIEALVEAWRADPGSRATAAAVVIGLMASDVVLPIPSSLVGVAAGMTLGAGLGTIAAATGATLGAAIGWGLGRLAGPAGLPRLVGARGVADLSRLATRVGPAVLVATRPIPVLAELAAIGAGAAGLSLPRTVLACLPANVAVAAVYAIAGEVALAQGWPQAGLVVGLVVPALAMFVAARRARRRAASHEVATVGEPAEKA